MSASFDCQQCGQCCFGQRDYVQVFPSDASRLGPERMARFVAPPVGLFPARAGRPAEPLQYMRMEGNHCSALGLEGGRFTCGVYEDRPEVCRGLEAGTSPCLEARAAISPDAKPALASPARPRLP